MYLLVFTTLMIGIIGLYTQVLGLQTARLASNQKAIGSTMLQWHTAAVSMAVSILKTNTIYPALVALPATYATGGPGCSLTFSLPPGVAGIAQCPSPVYVKSPEVPAGQAQTIVPTNVTALTVNSVNVAGVPGTITNGPASRILGHINYQATPTSKWQAQCVQLSPRCSAANTDGCRRNAVCRTSYDTINYQFYSALYREQATGQNYVITFLPAAVITAANPAPGYLTTVNATQLPVTAADLINQLRRAGAPSYSYGSINGANQLNTLGITYNLPAAYATLTNGNGAVAVITSPYTN